MPAEWRVKPLNRAHNRNSFDCGESNLNAYLARYAIQNEVLNITRTFVAVEEKLPEQILGFYSLTGSTIDKCNLPASAIKRFPNYPVPIVRLARLAVDNGIKGKGLGEYLLMDALDRSLTVADNQGCVSVIVDAMHERAKQFYEKYEFEVLPNQPLTLWLPIAAIRKLFSKK